jgi:hypothetical protein
MFRGSVAAHATAALRTSSMTVRYEIASAKCTRETRIAEDRILRGEEAHGGLLLSRVEITAAG